MADSSPRAASPQPTVGSPGVATPMREPRGVISKSVSSATLLPDFIARVAANRKDAVNAAAASSEIDEDAFPTAAFDVVKKHHKMSWLKQRRFLVVTSTRVWNCKPPAASGAHPEPTKSHLIEDLELIALKSKTSMMLRFKGDHDYFYACPRALDILWELRRRMAALKAARRLSAAVTAGGGECRKVLLQMFAAGTLDLPQYNEQDGSVEKKLDLIRAIRSGAVDGIDRIAALVTEVQRMGTSSDIAFGTVREAIDSLKASIVDRLMASASPSPVQFGDSYEAECCTEEALQSLIVVPVFDTLWPALHLDSDVVGQENTFLSQCELLSRQPLEFFGVAPDLVEIKYDLVLQQLGAVAGAKTPSDMLENIVSVAKSILLTVRAARRVATAGADASPRAAVGGADAVIAASPSPPPQDGAPGSRRERSETLAADDVLPLYIYILCHSQVRDLVFVREWIMRLGDPNECSERSYYFTMFCSAIEYVTTCSPSGGRDDSAMGTPCEDDASSPDGRFTQTFNSMTFTHSPFSASVSCSPSPHSSPHLRCRGELPGTLPTPVVAMIDDSGTVEPQRKGEPNHC